MNGLMNNFVGGNIFYENCLHLSVSNSKEKSKSRKKAVS